MEKSIINETLDYYDRNAERFVSGTVSADMEKTQEKFLSKLRNGGRILDFGCGSGRDTKYFMDKGLEVDATDGSAELCRLASEYTGIKVRHMLFEDLDAEDLYDGIWACSSILHLPKDELRPVLVKMTAALKNGGIVYTSFKYGDFEGVRKGRYFTYFTEDGFRDFTGDIENLELEESWITADVRPERDDEKWLNLIMRKK